MGEEHQSHRSSSEHTSSHSPSRLADTVYCLHDSLEERRTLAEEEEENTQGSGSRRCIASAPASSDASNNEMNYYNRVDKTSHPWKMVIWRRLVIAILLGAINLMVWLEWNRLWKGQQGRLWLGGRSSLSNGPIRGSRKMRLLGEVCLVDRESGHHHLVNSRHAIVIDAGSTGSRVHIYEFQFCGERLTTVVDEVFEEVKPGLSHYYRDPHLAVQSLRPLLQTAGARVPDFVRKCTPMVVKATAGLRLLPEHAVTGILGHLRKWLTLHPFLLRTPEESVSVMDGSEEAVLAWATVNFLLDRWKADEQLHPDDTSVVMDLGGGSTQIVFAVQQNMQLLHHDVQRQYYYRLSLHGQHMDLYQQSYLGYGLMEARKSIKSHHIKRMLADAPSEQPLWFPCFIKGHSEPVGEGNTPRGDHKSDSTSTYTLMGSSAGWDACLQAVRPIFRLDETCSVQPCSFNGIHQPPLRSKSLIAFSYFFDRLIPLGLTSPVTLFDIDREGRKLCQPQPDSRHQRLLEENPNWCLDLAYIYTLLRVGYRVDLDQPITVTKQINGYEAGWSLGAALKLLENVPNTCVSTDQILSPHTPSA